ncbi:MAG: hexapeptide repeat-containing transferase, partial [Pseudomonas sp.]|nr:hexapeptide repeat-containing transferase [Pseudomonas sp.]
MKHRMMHSHDLREALPDYAIKMGVPLDELQAAYEWMLQNDVCFEARIKERTLSFISYLNIEPRIEHPLARRFYRLLASETQGA